MLPCVAIYGMVSGMSSLGFVVRRSEIECDHGEKGSPEEADHSDVDIVVPFRDFKKR